jgi:hypothetical protein
MVEISLTQDKVALVNDEDFELVSQYNWHIARNRYAVTKTSRKNAPRKDILMHRLIMRAEKGQQVDHINGNGLDNRRENLRFCTHAENQHNISYGYGKSRYKGVHWHKNREKWCSAICYNSKKIYLGSFSSEIEAARAYDEAAKQYFGAFAHLNFISSR